MYKSVFLAGFFLLGLSACQTTQAPPPVMAVKTEHLAPSAKIGAAGVVIPPRSVACPDIGSGFKSYTDMNGDTRSRSHTGLDFAVDRGTPVYASYDGTVVIAAPRTTGGNRIILVHEFGAENAPYLFTNYLHLMAFAKDIERGVRVKRGQVIGFVGNTGTNMDRYRTHHLHFETHAAQTPNYDFRDQWNGVSVYFSDSRLSNPAEFWDNLDGIEANFPAFLDGMKYSEGKISFPLPCKITY